MDAIKIFSNPQFGEIRELLKQGVPESNFGLSSHKQQQPVTLTKQSTPSQIEQYFRGVLALDGQNNVFSVNLDDVWQLAYARKDSAVRGLRVNFIENVDFIVIHNNVENPQDGRPVEDYYLTSSCLEYFVARKVRPVFEVYRKVFHHVAHNIQQSPSLTEQVNVNLAFADWNIKQFNLNEASKLGWAKKIGDKFGLVTDALPQSVNAGTDNPTTHSATDLLKQHNVGLSARAFNKVLELKGVVKLATRPGRYGKVHNWYVLQSQYDRFGENQQNPQFQQQTQIRWYDATFDELLVIVGLSRQQTLQL